ncbi:MAG: flagellar export protein FliJ [Planctomycetes bacterium]|nr:flagellar export protein FliJ [Planctomycetota bacterium]
MKRYRFRLDPLLHLRESLRDQRRAQLADALRVDVSLNEQKERLLADQQRARHGYTAHVGAVNVDRLLEAQRFATVLEVERLALEQQLAKLKVEIEKRRLALVDADQQVRTLEKLRDTQAERWRLTGERLAQRELDEIAIQRHARQEAL